MNPDNSKASNYSFFLGERKKKSLKTKTAPNEASESCRPSWQLRTPFPLHGKAFWLTTS